MTTGRTALMRSHWYSKLLAKFRNVLSTLSLEPLPIQTSTSVEVFVAGIGLALDPITGAPSITLSRAGIPIYVLENEPWD